MRFAVITLVLCFAAVARAETDMLVLGPTADASTPADLVAHAKAVLEKSGLSMGASTIDTLCAADTSCLSAAGAKESAHHVVAVTVSGTAASVKLSLMLVDVDGKDLIAKRDLTIPDKKLAKDFGPQLKKFLDEGPIDRSKELFAQGNKHYELGEFADALDLYKKAYRVKPFPAFQFNIAQCYRKLGDHRNAVLLYQAYLVGVPNASNKDAVQSLINESNAAIAAEQKRKDDEATRKHQLEEDKLATERKKADDARKAKEAEAAAASEHRKTEEARLSAEHQKDLEKTYNHHPVRKPALVAGAVGLAGMVAGGVAALLVRSTQKKYDDAQCGDSTVPRLGTTLSDCLDWQKQGHRYTSLEEILLASGGGLFALSFTIFVLDPGNVERPDDARAKVAVSPTGVQVVIKW
jgi:tetratricopeptide (TPR) repeat protein